MTLDQIAKLAGVSKTTASYVINGKAQQYRISKKTQQKVMAVVEQHDYRPDLAASSLRVGSSRSFGLIIPDLENTSYARLAKLLEQNSRKAGYQILIACSDDDSDTERAVVQALMSRKIDVLFVASCLPDANDFYLSLQKRGTPVVALDRPLDDEYFCCVLSEDLGGAYELARSILTEQVKTIGVIGALPELAVSSVREQGFRRVAKESDLEFKVGYGNQFNREEGKAVFAKWIAEGNVPEAVITTSYTLLEGVLDELILNPQIASKLKLATFGDNRLLDFLPFKVNSLPQQFEIIADSALILALSAVGKKYQAGVKLVPRKIVVRN
ncbi:catabolite repressor/activator [Vibrio kasasachensis]|uniref:catabolite repressor/activator n=1 Tax=Vibrio kasasachensis TaxID=2910248 RepID=UPI003D0E3911